MSYTAEQFRNLIRGSGVGTYQINEDEKGNFTLLTDCAEGKVVFYEQDIVELIITSLKDGANVFYLHFRIEDEDHAKDLFAEMRQTLISLKNKKRVKVLLSCTSGLTTSFFASELSRAADTLRLDYEFAAVSFDRIYEEGFSYDIILLAPQIHHQYNKTKQIFRDAVVMKIPAAVFGQYNTGEMIDMIKKIIIEIDEKEQASKKADPRKPFENPYRILSIGMINQFGSFRIGYRVYDHGKRSLDGEVLKPSFSLQDITDIIDYVFSLEEKIDAIAIAVPGVTYGGRVYHEELGLKGEFLAKTIREKYNNTPTILANDVNAMALGYYALNEDADDMVFYFQPTGHGAGAGIIIDGKLRTGIMHGAGEIFSLIKDTVIDYDKKTATPEGTLELVTKGILAFIATIAPKKVVLYSKLAVDMDELIKELQKKVAAQYIPQIEHTPGLKRYILPGAMVHCLEVLRGYQETGDWHGYEKKRENNS